MLSRLRRGGLSECSLKEETRLAVVRSVVRNDLGLGRVNDLDVVKGGVERRRCVPNQLAEALYPYERSVHGLLEAGDQPLLIPHVDHRTGCDVEFYRQGEIARPLFPLSPQWSSKSSRHQLLQQVADIFH